MQQSPRARFANDRPPAVGRRYVLYWTQMFRRLSHNHALDYALARAVEWKKPLVVYEGLKLGYPWASHRTHRFILEGIRDNAARAADLGINYWPFVETPDQPGRGLLRRLAADACAVVTDDFPAFIAPDQTAALAAKVDVPVVAVDSNGVVPLSSLGAPVSMAVHLRTRIHKAFAAAWREPADAEPRFPRITRVPVDSPFPRYDARTDLGPFLDSLPLDATVRPVEDTPGGASAANQRLAAFVADRLPRYGEERNQPAVFGQSVSSGLSPYLHFGHMSAQAVVAAVLDADGGWSLDRLEPAARGKREGFFTGDPNVDGFLDEVITWRDVGSHWMWHRRADAVSLERALPPWAWATLKKHSADHREFVYSREEFEAAATHDRLWNAAQTELVRHGRIHNYLRMLWGKKVLEWSRTPDEAYSTLEHLNNKYALDGRDPNSYSGILWCFGLFDRPWPPERPIFGTVRYMSSDRTSQKFDLAGYLNSVESQPVARADTPPGPA